MNPHDIDAIWTQLTPLFRWRGLTARWIYDLEKFRCFQFVEQLGEAAWGHLAECGWQELAPPPSTCPADTALIDDERSGSAWAVGMLDPEWAERMVCAAQRLAEAGGRAGPSGDAAHWLSYLCIALSEPKAIFAPRIDGDELPLTVAGGEQFIPFRPGHEPLRPSRRQTELKAFEALRRVHRCYLRQPNGRRRYALAFIWQPGGYRIVHHDPATADAALFARVEAAFSAPSPRRVGGRDVIIDDAGQRRVIYWDGIETVYPGDPAHFLEVAWSLGRLGVV